MKAFILLTSLIVLGSSTPAFDVVMNQLQEQVAKSSYGKQLVDLVELHLLQGSPVQEVLQIIEQILNQLESDQNAEDIQHSSRMAEYDATITSLGNRLESLNLENQENNRNIGELSENIASLAQSVGTIQRQLTLISSREEAIRQTRTDETAALQRRQQNNERILNAITQIKTRLSQTLNSQGSLIEVADRDQIIAQAKKELGDSNPITLLIQASNKFDAPTVRRVIEKLDAISEAIRNSRVSDDQNEETAQHNFQTVVSELDDVRERLSTDYSASNNLQRTRSNDLITAQRRRDEIAQTQTQTDEILVQTRNQRSQFDGSYSNRRSSRLAEIELIRQAHELISNHSQQLQARN